LIAMDEFLPLSTWFQKFAYVSPASSQRSAISDQQSAISNQPAPVWLTA
jgi:hypothetical protein